MEPKLDLLVGLLEPAPAPGEHDRADGRDQQQDRGDLEREQVFGQNKAPMWPGVPNPDA